jgi:hypothetical protein
MSSHPLPSFEFVEGYGTFWPFGRPKAHHPRQKPTDQSSAFRHFRVTLLTISQLWELAKEVRNTEEITASKIFQIRHDASEAKPHEHVEFASVKRPAWMTNCSSALAGDGPFWLWNGLSCRLGGTSGCHECMHNTLNAVFQSCFAKCGFRFGKITICDSR